MSLTLDYRTLYLSVTLTAFVTALAMLYVWHIHRREPAIAWWAAGFLICAIATTPVSGDPAALPALVKLLGNVLNLGSTACLYVGTAIFLGRPPQIRLLTLLYTAAFAIIIWWAFAVDYWPMRVLGHALAAGTTLLLMARDLWSAGSGPTAVLYRTVAVCWLLFVAAIVQRCYGIFLDGTQASLHVIDRYQFVYLGTLQAVLIFAAIGHLLMSSQRLQLRLDALAHRDELTGVLNRRAFHSMFDALREQHGATHGALLVVDIDHFKQINDRYGHAAGDVVLRAVAEVLAAQLRGGDIFARAGGEEFWVHLRQVDGDAAARIAERLRHSVAEHAIMIAGEAVRVTVSIGLLAGVGGEDLGPAIARADAALYTAKNAGRNRVVAA